MTRARTSYEIPVQVAENMLRFSSLPVDTLMSTLGTRMEGLTEEEVDSSREKYGKNEIGSEKPPTWHALLIRNFYNPFVLLLITLSIVSSLLKDFHGATIILAMVIISIFMRFIQEYRSNRSAAKLKALISTRATVHRRCQETTYTREIPFIDLVPGDVIQLSAGDMIPADIRLLSARDFFVSQAALTGESMPKEKHAQAECRVTGNENSLDLPNICLMGTNVVSGIGQAVVIATGGHTYFGMIAKKIIAKRPLTSFDIGINKISWLLLRLMLFMVPLVFIINGVGKHDWFESLLFALSVAVGLTPELLPMIVTANLAKGATNMSKSRVIVKQLNSIQNFGAMTILCTDKTGPSHKIGSF